MASIFRRNFWRVAALPTLFLLVLFSYFLILELASERNFRKAAGAEILIHEALFRAEVASTPIARARGLSGRDFLAADSGMLFTFDKPAIYSFWMKDMRFPIDIIWLRDAKVVYVAKNVLPPGPGISDSELKVYSPSVEADMVLEVAAGMVDKFGISVGDAVSVRLASD